MKTWTYLVNVFLKLFLANFKKAVKISTYTDNVLSTRTTDAFYAAQYAIYHPVHDVLLNTYNKWKNDGGKQKGATLTLDQLLELLSPDKINDWEVAVRNVFKKGQPDYLTIFPQGHKPFQKGEKDQRIHAVEQLIKSLEAFPQLAQLKADVEIFYGLLTNARTVQVGIKGSSTTDDLSKAAADAAKALYALLGACINRFAANPTEIELVFDLKTIREHLQVIFSGTLAAHETENIMEHTFAATDEIKLHNTGNTTLNFYLAANATDSVENYITVAVKPNSSDTITADKLNVANRFLYVSNADAAEGHYKVSLL